MLLRGAKEKNDVAKKIMTRRGKTTVGLRRAGRFFDVSGSA